MLNYPALKRTTVVELTAADEVRLAEMVASLQRLASQATPPPRITHRKFCLGAFEELCCG
jgi:hypothetical protein